MRIVASSSRNAVNNSSACTTSRFPPPRCASGIQMVRPLESTAETQPQLQPALGILDDLRCSFARFKLGADLLDLRCLLCQPCCEGLNFLLLLCGIRLQ